jgi:uncharacterized membrane protein YgcG
VGRLALAFSAKRDGPSSVRWPAVLLATAIALVVAPLALAFDLPPSQAGRSVYDFAGIWSSSTIDAAEQTADRLRSQTGVQMAIVSIPSGESSVDTSEAEQTAKDIMDAWGVGQAGVDNGIVVLFDLDTSLRHGQIYIYGGRGIVRLYLSPAAAQNVANDMIARAKAGDLNGALGVGMDEIAAAVDNPGSRLESAPLLNPAAVVVVLVSGLLVVVVLGVWWRDGRDPPIPLIDDSVLLPAPPPGLTPSMAALLHDAVTTKNAPAAALVDLASRNLIGMREGSTLLGIGHKPIDYVVSDPNDQRVAHAETLVGEPERIVLHALRGIASDGVVEHKELRRLTRLRAEFSTALGKGAAATPWFRSDPNAAMNRVALLAVVPFLVLFGVMFFVQDQVDGVSAIVMIVATGIAVVVGLLASRAMAARTKEGSWVLGMALAYRNTLRHEMGVAPGVITAHEHAKLKMPWLETPDALIVWAVALGLADEVGHLISRSVNDPASASWHPAWYAGSAASFASFGSSISSINVTAASSTGGGYGGGSSGGGGGGGGGF